MLIHESKNVRTGEVTAHTCTPEEEEKYWKDLEDNPPIILVPDLEYKIQAKLREMAIKELEKEK